MSVLNLHIFNIHCVYPAIQKLLLKILIMVGRKNTHKKPSWLAVYPSTISHLQLLTSLTFLIRNYSKCITVLMAPNNYKFA